MNLPLTPEKAKQLSPQQLAFIGDAVFTLMARLDALGQGFNVRAMHASAASHVSAAAQARALECILAVLTEEEIQIVRRGRNAHASHQAPRSATVAEYSASTGLEALIGYHYLTGHGERLADVVGQILRCAGTISGNQGEQ